MRRRDLTVRAAGLVLTGELAVHELRYVVAPGHATGHGYLPLFGVVSVLLLALAAGQLAGRLERARSVGADDRVRVSFRAAWAGLALAIVLIFGIQESLEAALGGGGLAVPGVAAFGGGGWVAVPLAFALSALLALALKGAGAAVSAAARVARDLVAPRVRAARLPQIVLLRPCRAPLARNLAGRGPPLALRP